HPGETPGRPAGYYPRASPVSGAAKHPPGAGVLIGERSVTTDSLGRRRTVGGGVHSRKGATMRTASRWMLVTAVAFTVAGVAAAQAPRRPGGGQPGGFGGMTRGGGAAMLLANEGVQKELKLTDDQKTKVKEFSDAQREKMRGAFGGGQPDP